MAENTKQPKQVTSTVQKAIAGLGARLQTAVGGLDKLQSKGVAQTNLFIEVATRATQDQVVFAEQIGAECRKLVLAATRKATGLLTPKS